MTTIFVFYNIKDESNWKYENMPIDWNWIGSGSVQPLIGNKKNSQYMREEQFNGSSKTRKQMRDYLHNFFTNLMKNNIVSKFKIRNSYLP